MTKLEIDPAHRATVYASAMDLQAAPTGESAIIVPVQVPVAVTRLRERMDPAAARSVPAHVTLLYPFMAPDLLKEDIRRGVEQVIANEPTFAFSLRAVGRWPGVVYLVPEPDEPFRRLTLALAEAFPDYPPYEGAHPEVTPHLTVAQDVPDDWLAAAEHALAAVLPVHDVVREAWLIGHTPEQLWQTLWRLPLGEPPVTYPGAAAG
jgi:2'-5' RNA ligase